DAAGGDVLARWTHTLRGGSQTVVQTYYDTYRRSDFAIPETLRSFDIDFQHHLNTGGRHEIVWGAGARANYTSLAQGYSVAFPPPSVTQGFYSAFLQDEVRVAPSFWLTAGSKIEHNALTGFQAEPSLRLVWSPPQGRRALWAAASRALRQPSRQDTDVQTTLFEAEAAPGVVQVARLFGNRSEPADEVRDYELGYRSDLSRNVSVDITAFLSFYRRLQTYESQPVQFIPGPALQILIPYQYEGQGSATDCGGEASLNWTVNSHWRLSTGYAYLHADLRQD